MRSWHKLEPHLPRTAPHLLLRRAPGRSGSSRHVAYVAKRLKASLFHLSEQQFRQVVLAYEPIWAIGTGRTASSARPRTCTPLSAR